MDYEAMILDRQEDASGELGGVRLCKTAAERELDNHIEWCLGRPGGCCAARFCARGARLAATVDAAA